MISGQGDIAMAVNAIKSGALDFIEKPFRGSEIVARLDEAIEAYARRQAENSTSRIATMHFPGPRTTHAKERECSSSSLPARPTGSRKASRDQPANDRGSPRQYHEEARGAECRRSGPDRDDHLAAGLTADSRRHRSVAERLTDQDGRVRFAEG